MEWGPGSDNPADIPAAYAILVSSHLGPLLLSSLRRAGLANPPRPTVTFVVTATDLVELAQRVTKQGITIECLRAIDDVED